MLHEELDCTAPLLAGWRVLQRETIHKEWYTVFSCEHTRLPWSVLLLCQCILPDQYRLP